MNRWDTLLAWLHERESTNWQNVKNACSRLSCAQGIGDDWPPIFHALHWARPLFVLGHAEYCESPRRKTVDISPPAIIWSRAQERGLLYGYWSGTRLRVLKKCGLRLFKHCPKVGPTCWSVKGPRAILESAAEATKARFSEDIGGGLLKRLPNAETFLKQLPPDNSSTSGSWEKLFFQDQHARWVATKGPPVEPGLYQRKSGEYEKIAILRDGQKCRIKKPDPTSYAKWFNAPNIGITAIENKRYFLIPYGAPSLPMLVERGLTLASGRLPMLLNWEGRKMWRYTHVPIMNARLVTSILGQEMQIVYGAFNDKG